jgi:hypothetical protein
MPLEQFDDGLAGGLAAPAELDQPADLLQAQSQLPGPPYESQQCSPTSREQASTSSTSCPSATPGGSASGWRDVVPLVRELTESVPDRVP